jgi:unsaturated chondroitin disaccharide hydrolase
MKQTLVFIILLSFSSACISQKKTTITPNKGLLQTARQNFADAAKQYKVMMATLPPDKFPKTFDPKTGKPEYSIRNYIV